MRSDAGSLISRLVDEQLRRGSARATRTIVQRSGERLGFWIGCGYPKSGTVWLCQLLSSCLELPYPRFYRLPLAMPCVVHAHWLPSPSLPRTLYIVRDGRDVMVSLYFYEVRRARGELNPRLARSRRLRFEHLLGPGADLDDAMANLPRFMAAELQSPAWMKASWPVHVNAWLDVPPDRAAVVRYEDLLVDVESALAPAIESLTGSVIDRDLLRSAATRYEFKRQTEMIKTTGPQAAQLRKGISGDWKNYFSDESYETFHRLAGGTLERAGYTL